MVCEEASKPPPPGGYRKIIGCTAALLVVITTRSPTLPLNWNMSESEGWLMVPVRVWAGRMVPPSVSVGEVTAPRIFARER